MCQNILPLISSVRKCSFSFTVWKVLALSIWCCSLGPNGRWRDNVCTVLSMKSKKEMKSQRITHKARWVGWTLSSTEWSCYTTCPLIIIKKHQKQNIFPQMVSAQFDSCTYILDPWHGIHNMCVWFYQQQDSFQEMSDFFFLLGIYRAI